MKLVRDLEERVRKAIEKEFPDHHQGLQKINLPPCLILNGIYIGVIDVSEIGKDENEFIISEVRADVTLKRLS